MSYILYELADAAVFMYAEYHVAPSGQVDQWVIVIVQRVKGTGSPDNYPMGVVTAFCQTGSGANETLCPSWVNSTL